MKRRLFAALALAPAFATATPPAVTLLVEWRWVDSELTPAAIVGVRDGAVVVGTAGSVSPRGAVVTSSAPPAAPLVQQLMVLNGERASVRLDTREPLQWVEAVVELGARPRIHALPRQRERLGVERFEVTPTWPGGRAPVRVAFSTEQDGRAVESTQLLPLQRWQAVARSGGPGVGAPRGTLSSRDAEARPQRELQLRISLQP